MCFCSTLVIVIFYCANATPLHMPDWKFSEGGRLVKLGCKMGRCMKKAESHCSKLRYVTVQSTRPSRSASERSYAVLQTGIKQCTLIRRETSCPCFLPVLCDNFALARMVQRHQLSLVLCSELHLPHVRICTCCETCCDAVGTKRLWPASHCMILVKSIVCVAPDTRCWANRTTVVVTSRAPFVRMPKRYFREIAKVAQASVFQKFSIDGSHLFFFRSHILVICRKSVKAFCHLSFWDIFWLNWQIFFGHFKKNSANVRKGNQAHMFI